MHQKRKIIIKSVIGLLILCVVITFVAQIILKNKIENAIANNLPESLKFHYSELSLNLFRDYLEIHDLELTRIGETTKKTNIEVVLKKLRVESIGYWDYLFNETIHIEEVLLTNPEITYYHNNQIPKQEYMPSHLNSFNKTVEIDNFQMEDGTIKIFDAVNDSLILDIKTSHISVKDILHDSETIKNKIPINYGDYNFRFEHLFFSLSEYENLTAEKSELSKTAYVFRNLNLKTKYSERALSKMISVERDHYNIEIDSVNVEQFQLGFLEDSILQIGSPQIVFSKPNMRVYRDKLVTDDQLIKPLYSKLLRDLNFELNLDTLIIKDAFISYSEKVKVGDKAGEITFSNFNATIDNVSNMYASPTKTSVVIDTEFMEHAPLHAKWEFDVNNRSDLFLFQADIGQLEAPYLNTFTEPNLNKRIEGELYKTYFTITGNSETSKIDFKVKYDHFDIVALKKNGKDKNKLLSKVVNLFVSKNSNKTGNGFKEVTKTGIKRDKTKSVFNFIWLNTRAGLLKAMTFE